jgi:hypothetical protein
MLNRFQTGANKEARTNRSSSWPGKAAMSRGYALPREQHIGGLLPADYKDSAPTEHKRALDSNHMLFTKSVNL